MSGCGWAHLVIPNKFSCYQLSPCKNLRYQLIPSRDNDDQTILQSNLKKTFWLKTCESEFLQIWGLHRKIENQKIIPLRLLPAKSNNKLSQKLKNNNYFWSILAILEKINLNPKNWTLSLLSSYISLTSCTKHRKTNEHIPRKVCYEWTNE